MIKIIKKGTKETITCDECGCYFSYEEEDIQIKEIIFSGKYILTGGPTKKIIICPQCKKEICLFSER